MLLVFVILFLNCLIAWGFLIRYSGANYYCMLSLAIYFSSLFSNPVIGMLVGFLTWFVNFFPYFFLANRYEQLSM